MAEYYQQLASEVLRALRGTRSQRAFSRRLKRTTNVAYAWETGRSFPTLETARAAARLNDTDILARFAAFSNEHPAHNDHELLSAVRGSLSHGEVARRMGMSASQVSRWMSGKSEPKLPDVFRLVDVCTARLEDFVALFVAPSEVPCIRASWTQLEERRRLARELPWSHGILRALELSAYASLTRHSDSWIAQQLGIDEQLVAEGLRALLKAGLVQKKRGLYRVAPTTVDMATAPVASRNALKQHWLEVAHDHFHRRNDDDLFSYNVVSISQRDLGKLRQMHVDYFHAVRQLVAESSHPECVVLVSMQLLQFPPVPAADLGEPERTGGRPQGHAPGAPVTSRVSFGD